jgi:asparagine synthetase B (glutamine-hydrolysing)
MEPAGHRSRKRLQADLTDLLHQAVRRRTRKGRVGLLLSGGVDSRGILAVLDDPVAIRAVTFTTHARETRPPLGDWAIAETCARQVGMPMSVVPYDPRDFAEAMQASVSASDGAAGFVFQNIWDRIREETKIQYLLRGDECMGWCTGPISATRVLPSVGLHSLGRMSELKRCFRRGKVEAFVADMEAELETILSSCHALTPYDRVDELYLGQRWIHYLQPKERILSRAGMHVRNPWLDRDVLDFVRTLPARCRLRKRLFRQTLARLAPSLFRIPRARESEFDNYRSALRAAEREDGTVSRLVFQDNPLLEDFFEQGAVKELIEHVCSRVPSPKTRSRFDPRSILPVSMFVPLYAVRNYVTDPPPRLTGARLLLRIATTALALRHLAKRLARRPAATRTVEAHGEPAASALRC